MTSTTDLHLRGATLRSGDPGYDEARLIWNGMFHDRRPGMIARCAGPADVINAVNYAREQGLSVAVRGGGHSFPGYSVCDDGIMIDLAPMKSIRVDPSTKTVRAEAGVLWGEFDAETQAFGLATTGGQISHTGIAGLTLGGGFGWLCRKHGLTVDNLLSVDIVTADGSLLRASAEEHPDLFWGIRGGGGNFGIVTSFEFQLHDLTPTVFAGLVVYPLAEARQVLGGYDDLMAQAGDDVMVGAFILTAPDGNPAVGIAPAYLGADQERGAEMTAPFQQLGTAVVNEVGPMPYTALQQLIDGAAVPGRRYYMRSSFINAFTEDAIDALSESYATSPSPFNAVVIAPFGGAVARVPADETAFFHRDVRFSMTLLGAWEQPQDDEANIAWLRSTWDRIQPFLAGGVYVNELHDEGPERVREAYGATWDRLVALKREYDPENLFRLNQNIDPNG